MEALKAGEQLQFITSLMAGTGSMEADARAQYMSTLQLTANHGTTPRRPAQQFESAEAAMAHMSGLGVAT